LCAGCSKDKLESKPKIDLKSVNTKFISTGGTLTVNLNFKDKEGDLDDSLYVIRQRMNRRGLVTARPSGYKIPAFGGKDKGEIEVNLTYSALTFNISPIKIPGVQANEPDTLNLGFVVRDKAKNLSDTVRVDNVIVTR
jgi:hypothetical protein